MQNLIVVVVVLAVLSVSFAHIHDLSALEGYNFEQFNKDYGLGLKAGTSEYVLRKAFFDIELARVKAHNKMNRGWKETVNKFSAMSKDEKRKFHGRNKGAHQSHKLKGLKDTKEVLTLLTRKSTENFLRRNWVKIHWSLPRSYWP